MIVHVDLRVSRALGTGRARLPEQRRAVLPGKREACRATRSHGLGTQQAFYGRFVKDEVFKRFPVSLDGSLLALSAQVTSLDGRERVAGTITGTDPEATGAALASVLRDRGAGAILDRIREPTAR